MIPLFLSEILPTLTGSFEVNVLSLRTPTPSISRSHSSNLVSVMEVSFTTWTAECLVGSSWDRSRHQWITHNLHIGLLNGINATLSHLAHFHNGQSAWGRLSAGLRIFTTTPHMILGQYSWGPQSIWLVPISIFGFACTSTLSVAPPTSFIIIPGLRLTAVTGPVFCLGPVRRGLRPTSKGRRVRLLFES